MREAEMLFDDRIDAGRQLAGRLGHLRGADVVVLGLPRGGVPVAAEVAMALDAPLDVILVRKLGAPAQPELALGAIGEDGIRVVDDEIVRLTAVAAAELEAVEHAERIELHRRGRLLETARHRVDIRGRTVVIVDDGIATGSTARAACAVARAHGVARVVLAVPVAPQGWQTRLGSIADEFVCVAAPSHLESVGRFYADFSATSDDDMITCLQGADARSAAPRGVTVDSHADPSGRVDDVVIVVDGVSLLGMVAVPPDARGIVVFSHGCGSSRLSPRNRQVARELYDAGFATMLFDLLASDEECQHAHEFDVVMLAGRLGYVTDWAHSQPGLTELPIGYFGASTGAAAAMWAAGEPGTKIAAIVSRGGRPDLATDRLSLVDAPTMLIVGGDDQVVLDLNRRAQATMNCETCLAVIPGASHLFDEPGALESVGKLARDWFSAHLGSSIQHRVGSVC